MESALAKYQNVFFDATIYIYYYIYSLTRRNSIYLRGPKKFFPSTLFSYFTESLFNPKERKEERWMNEWDTDDCFR